MITKESILSLESTANQAEAFDRLYHILNMLRSPEGCPWDRKQTPGKFQKNLIEEAYEYIDALDKDDTSGCQEELGDLYLVVTMLAIMHEESHAFSVAEILNSVSDKMIRRHPHVFTQDVNAADADEVLTLWDEIKEQVEGKQTTHENPYERVPSSMPPLERAEEIQKIARKKGFDWPDHQGAFDKIEEELQELKEAIHQQSFEHIEEEFGDLLFSIINTARLCKVTPHIALHKTNEKFMRRYNDMVQLFNNDQEKPFSEASLDEMDSYWEQAKSLSRR
jgi:MazG family protein